jgi:hypothetical protein
LVGDCIEVFPAGALDRNRIMTGLRFLFRVTLRRPQARKSGNH